MEPRKYRPEDDGSGAEPGAEDSYLSKLAQSILSKERKGAPRQGPISPMAPLPSSASVPKPSFVPPTPSLTSRPVSPGTSSTMVPRLQAPSPRSSTEVRRPTTAAEVASQAGMPREWIREVDFYDDRGALIPGTILVFEDGTMGIYKEANPSKEYDIVYQLRENGKAVPQGMPLYTYEVEPVGRLTPGSLEHLVQSQRWERDVIVFHLLKYKDRKHIPTIVEQAPPSTGMSSESVNTWAVQKMLADEQRPTAAAEVGTDRPALTRGRKLTIAFGPNQKWEAVYWGKDELGHVVAHSTHDKWSLMHLDLNRFKDTTHFGDLVGIEIQRRMEMDFNKA